VSASHDSADQFHFDDISKHVERVRERILAGATEQTADFVAHGLLDSIVDAFFPLIRYVDGEVDEIDSLTIDPTTMPRTRPEPAQFTSDLGSDEKGETGSSHDDNLALYDEKLGLQSQSQPHPSLRRRLRSCLPTWHLHIDVPRHKFGLVYLKLFFLPITSAVRQYPRPIEPVFDRTVLLRRIVEMRRIVTGMTRLLGTKHQVVGRLRKQLAESGNGSVEAYVGDVEGGSGMEVELTSDHILLLQTSLYHYEYILAHCQPTYLSHLKYSFHITRRLISKHILILSTVAVSILPIQTVTGTSPFDFVMSSTHA
jgi:Mg2+ and Co2+ transporter CorA